MGFAHCSILSFTVIIIVITLHTDALCASQSTKTVKSSLNFKRGTPFSRQRVENRVLNKLTSIECANMPDLSTLSPLEIELRKYNLPDRLTYARVFMIPAFIVTFILGMKAFAIGLYVASCITDFLDGYLARKWKQSTAFGAFLDPVADKLMVATALVLLVCQLPTWWFATPVALIMCRELGVSALREWMAERGKRALVQVGGLGKWKTALQMISTTLLMYACPSISEFDIDLSTGVSRPAVFSIGLVTMYVSTVLTLISGWQYLQAAWPELTAQGAK